MKKDAEIALLRRELRGSASKKEETPPRIRDTAKLVGDSAGFGDLIKRSLRSLGGRGRFRRIFTFAGRLAGISRTARTVWRVVSFLRTGASALLILGIAAILIPAAVVYFGLAAVLCAVASRAADVRVRKISGNVFVIAQNERTRVFIRTERELSRRGTVVHLMPSAIGVFSERGGAARVGIAYFFRMKKILRRGGAKIYFIE